MTLAECYKPLKICLIVNKQKHEIGINCVDYLASFSYQNMLLGCILTFIRYKFMFIFVKSHNALSSYN